MCHIGELLCMPCLRVYASALCVGSPHKEKIVVLKVGSSMGLADLQALIVCTPAFCELEDRLFWMKLEMPFCNLRNF